MLNGNNTIVTKAIPIATFVTVLIFAIMASITLTRSQSNMKSNIGRNWDTIKEVEIDVDKLKENKITNVKQFAEIKKDLEYIKRSIDKLTE